jgi:hypothetical protein
MSASSITSPVDDRRSARDLRPDFHRLLGDAAWRRLPEAVKARFCAHPHMSATTYRGRMKVRATRLGRFLACACQLIGTPVAPFEGNDVPVEVHVYDVAGGGTVWERRYAFAGRPETVVRSMKKLDDDGSLVEALNAGLHMRLRVFEDQGALHFLSTGYFFRIGPLRVPLPDWFPPGPTHVVHEDRDDGRFTFTMRTEHPLLGEMFFQSGVFE